MIRTLIASLTLIALISTPAAAKGDAAEENGKAAFQSLAKLVVGGVWTRTDDEQYKHSYRWAIKGKFIHRVAKGGPLPDVAMIGVDPKTQQCVWWFYNQDGSVGKSVCTLEKDGAWSFVGTSEGSKGKNSYKGRAIRVDDNTIKIETEEWIANGEKQESGTFTWKRSRKLRDDGKK